MPFNLPQRFAAWFPFSLNLPQLEVGKKIFENNENILVIAPTGAGKTAIGELAVAKELMKNDESKRKGPVAILLVPLKAITSERIRGWENRQDVKVAVVTAETTIGTNDILACDVVISVPEKIDSITRSPDSKLRTAFESVRVLVVDEIHLLDMDGRGDALEALITRFLANSRNMSKIRIIALSATVPNFEDIAAWLQVPSSCVFRYGNEFRPVKLETHVLSYHKGESLGEDRQRQDEIVLEQIDIVLKDERQVIVFVNSRKGCEKLAKKMVSYWDKMGIHGDLVSAETLDLSANVMSTSLSKVIFAGVGFHHAGLGRKDRGRIELAFINGFCKVLISTTTLAWGVNLPADIVIVRDVEIYDSLKGKMLIGAIDLQQMLGRAGRPGYSRGIGHGLVIAPQETLSTVQKLIVGDSEIKSRLPESLKEHLLAEIVRGAILNTDDAVDWLKHTYYYLRLRSIGKDPFSIIKNLIEKNLEYLVTSGFINPKKDILKASPFGKLATRYYLRLETAKRFLNYLKAKKDFFPANLALLLAYAEEFEGVSIRKDERSFIEELDELIPHEANTSFPELNLGQKKIARLILALSIGESNLIKNEAAIYSTMLRLVSFMKELSELLFGSTLLPILEFADWLKGKKSLDPESVISLEQFLFYIDFKGFPVTMKVGESCYGLIIVKKQFISSKSIEVRILVNENLAFQGNISFENGIWKFPLMLQALAGSPQISFRVEIIDPMKKEPLIISEKIIEIVE